MTYAERMKEIAAKYNASSKGEWIVEEFIVHGWCRTRFQFNTIEDAKNYAENRIKGEYRIGRWIDLDNNSGYTQYI